MRYFPHMETPRDPNASRYEHVGKGLRRSDLDRDPIKQFGNWFTAAIEAGIRDVNAMSLATAGANGRPSVRIVLLKGFDHDGFVFFTNYESEKGKQLDANPYAALAFYWIELDRQIRISGRAEKLRGRIANLFSFASRGQSAGRLGIASKPGGRWTARAGCAHGEMTERFGDKRIPLPPHWGGYRVKPDTIEFWQGRPNRLHDRFRYTRQADNSWLIERLAP
ncbi:MAG: Pyridoxine/pyridoxamine 5'-phosphate oxidase [Candidatus Udaeobacter sp.]|nr:MAG: Pyridoxine/pyridoxamine 5'-phosphate oxidase [Candidatus Udaeobacter sp.]